MKNTLFIGQIAKSPNLLIVLLVISVCCLGGFLLKNAIGVGFEVDYSPVGFGKAEGYRDSYFEGDHTDVNGNAFIFRFGASPYSLPPPDFSSGDIIDLGEFPMEIENHTETPSEQ